MLERLSAIRTEAASAITAAKDVSELDEIQASYVGKKGAVTALAKQLSVLAPEERSAVGQQVNVLKEQLTVAIESRREELLDAEPSVADDNCSFSTFTC